MSDNKILSVPGYAHQLNLFLLKSQYYYSFIISGSCVNEINEIIEYIIEFYNHTKFRKNIKKKEKVLTNLKAFIKTISNVKKITNSIQNNDNDDIMEQLDEDNLVMEQYKLLEKDFNLKMDI